jgi:predicted transcriptional regulator of viral defense system
MPHTPTLRALANFAEDQWGLVTRRQAEMAGIARSTFDRLVAGGSVLRRVAHGVYHLTGAPLPDHVELRAAWLQLAPDVPAWDRTVLQGVVSHRSAAALYGLGHLPADTHEFTLPVRRQSRRTDVRIHHRSLQAPECIHLLGLPVTRPSRTVSDLLAEREDPEAVANIAADAIRSVRDYPGAIAGSLAAHAARFGLRQGDGLALLRWLLDLVGDPHAPEWIAEARAHLNRLSDQKSPPEVAPAHGQAR